MSPIKQGPMEVVESSLFDIAFLSRQTNYLFVQPVGQMDQSSPYAAGLTKDFQDTNMVQPGLLEEPRRFSIHEWNCRLLSCGAPLPVFSNLSSGVMAESRYEDTQIELQVFRKRYAEAKAIEIADWPLLVGNAYTDPKVWHGRYAALQAMGGFSAKRRFAEPLLLEPGQPFCVTVRVKTPDPKMQIRVNLIGKEARPIV